MKRFERVPQPPGWPEEAEQPGRQWLAAHPPQARGRDGRPKDLWTGKDGRFRRALRDGFGGLCAYTATSAPNGTVDHFLPLAPVRGTEAEQRAYLWSNLRYAHGWVNNAKSTHQWPDPFEVEDDWFELVLPSLELKLNPTVSVPAAQQDAILRALLVLGKSDNAVDQRREYWLMYREHQASLSLLDRFCPLLSRALRRQPQWLNAEDRSA